MSTKTSILNILVSPLDWGLGHTTRCIPIIRFLSESHNVFIAGNKLTNNYLKKYFPKKTYFNISGYEVEYSKSKWSIGLNFFFLFFKILKKIHLEHKELKKIISKKKIDLIISDNRYGFYSKNIPSVIITHQLKISYLGLEKISERFIQKKLAKFKEIWIPDQLDINLSGTLSKPYYYLKNRNIYHIGILSRFSKPSNTSIEKNNKEVLCIVSGPEPQKTIFLKDLIKELLKLRLHSTIICDKNHNETYLNKKIKIISEIDDKTLSELIQNSYLIISRGGYSTLMDLSFFNKPSLIIPTPFQPEQKYLANYHDGRNNHIYQKKINIKKAVKELKKRKSVKFDNPSMNKILIKERITFLTN